MIKAKWDERSVLRTKEILTALAMPPAKRKRLLYRVAKNVQPAIRRNIKQQKTPDGQPWEARKNKRKGKKKKVLLGLGKLLVVSNKSDHNSAKLTLKKGSYASKIHGASLANVHEKGQTIRHSKSSKTIGRKRALKDSDLCTRGQAKALKKMGFRVWGRRIDPTAKQGKTKVPTIAWMTKNLTQKEVRAVFRKLKDNGFIATKSSWEVNLPARKFMGTSRTKTRKAWERAFQGINYGWNVKAQNMKRG